MSGTAPKTLIEKVSDERLRQFASGDSERKRRVILELNLLRPTLKLGRIRRVGSRDLPKKQLLLNSAQEKSNKQKTTRIQGILRNAGIEHKFLPATGIILASVTPSDLRKAAASKIVKAIHPNNKRTVPALAS